MDKTKRLVLGGVLAVIVIAAAAWILWTPSERVDPALLERAREAGTDPAQQPPAPADAPKPDFKPRGIGTR